MSRRLSVPVQHSRKRRIARERRDVLLELMDAVARLEASSERHATQMESLAKISMETTAIVTALSGEVRMLWREVGNVSKRIESRLSEGFLDAAQGARLLVEFSGHHTDRFDRIENRLDTLERKAG